MTGLKALAAIAVLWPAAAFAQSGNLWNPSAGAGAPTAPATYLDSLAPSQPWTGAPVEVAPSKYAPADLDQQLSASGVYAPVPAPAYSAPVAPVTAPTAVAPVPMAQPYGAAPYGTQPFNPFGGYGGNPYGLGGLPYGYGGVPFAGGAPSYGYGGGQPYGYGASPYGYGGNAPYGYGGFFPGGGFPSFTSFPFGF